MKTKQYQLPDILIPELVGLRERNDRAHEFYVKHEKEITIGYIDAINAYDFGIDPTQLRYGNN